LQSAWQLQATAQEAEWTREDRHTSACSAAVISERPAVVSKPAQDVPLRFHQRSLGF
jgi:hypothetical protein